MRGDLFHIGYHGGILTNARKVLEGSDAEQQSISHCLHPGDLIPFTRKPMFLIVDSSNSVAFAVSYITERVAQIFAVLYKFQTILTSHLISY